MRHIGITRKDNGAKIEQETAHSYRYDSVFRKCNIPTNGECAERRKSLILRLQNQTLCTGQKRLSARRRCFPPAPRSNSGRHPTAWSRPFRNSKRPPYAAAAYASNSGRARSPQPSPKPAAASAPDLRNSTGLRPASASLACSAYSRLRDASRSARAAKGFTAGTMSGSTR